MTMGRARQPRLSETDPALRKYMMELKPSACPVCGRGQKTPRGEPMPCPKCVEGTAPKSVEALRKRSADPRRMVRT